jgi:hypothetical protein
MRWGIVADDNDEVRNTVKAQIRVAASEYWEFFCSHSGLMVRSNHQNSSHRAVWRGGGVLSSYQPGVKVGVGQEIHRWWTVILWTIGAGFQVLPGPTYNDMIKTEFPIFCDLKTNESRFFHSCDTVAPTSAGTWRTPRIPF